jgi:hypothetical protein
MELAMRTPTYPAMDGKLVLKCVMYTVYGLTLAACDYALARYQKHVSADAPVLVQPDLSHAGSAARLV